MESEKSTLNAKHVDIHFKFIYHHAQPNVEQPSFAKSDDMMADLLTKAQAASTIMDLRGMFKLNAIQDDLEDC